MKLSMSDQALSCIMVALQKSLMEQSDIVPVLKGFEFYIQQVDESAAELTVKNPPMQISAGETPKFVAE